MSVTFYVFLVNFDNIDSQPENHSYNDSALWSLEASLAPVPLETAKAATLAQRFAANRQRGEAVDIELAGGVRWTLRLRAVGAQWLSAETEGSEPRGVIISYRAVIAVRGLGPADAPEAPVVGVSMFQAVAHSIRHNPRVALGVTGREFVGVVAHLAEDYLELLPRPGLEMFTHKTVGRRAGVKSPASTESLCTPLERVDYLRWLEPGDSF